MLTYADVIAKLLADAGIEYIFGMPGSRASVELIEAARKQGIHYVLSNNESAAAVMAATYGVLHYLLLAWGVVHDPISWLGADHIMLSLIAVSVWQFFPFVLLAILARLQTIPEELYDAAKGDGASAVGRFVYITLPHIRGILFVVILLRSIWMFTKFDTVWLMGEGAGAGRFIRTLPVYAYMRTFTYYQAGLGSALAVVMFGILMAATVVYFALFRKEADIG